MKTQGIYVIRHVASGRVYVGSAVDVAKRWQTHRSLLTRAVHHAKRLQAAWTKAGGAAFTFTIVEVVADKQNLIEREQWWITELDAASGKHGFNTCPIAGSPLGLVIPPVTREKLRAALVGKPKSAEARANMRAASANRSPEWRAALSAALMGNVWSAESRAKIGAATRGRIVSAETRAKLSKASTGRPKSAETLAKFRAARVGHVVTPETRAKLRAHRLAHPILTFLGKRHSPETIERLRESSTGKKPSADNLAKRRASMKATLARKRSPRSHSSASVPAATSSAPPSRVPP